MMISNAVTQNTKTPLPAFRRQDDWSEYLVKVGNTQCELSFRALFDHFAPLIKGYCLSNVSMSLDKDAIDDLVQEVFTKIWLNAHKYDAMKSSAVTWIYTVARNARIDYIRKHARHQVSDNDFEVDDIWDIENEQHQYNFVKNKKDQETLDSYISALPESQSQCIKKVYMEGKTHSEISAELSLPLGTVKSRVRLGLIRLRDAVSTEQFALTAP